MDQTCLNFICNFVLNLPDQYFYCNFVAAARQAPGRIYQIQCDDCNKKYIGQTRCTISSRFKNHIALFKYNRFEESSVPQYTLETDHKVNVDNLKLSKQVWKNMELISYGSILINVGRNTAKLLNDDNGMIANSILYDLL